MQGGRGKQSSQLYLYGSFYVNAWHVGEEGMQLISISGGDLLQVVMVDNSVQPASYVVRLLDDGSERHTETTRLRPHPSISQDSCKLVR